MIQLTLDGNLQRLAETNAPINRSVSAAAAGDGMADAMRILARAVDVLSNRLAESKRLDAQGENSLKASSMSRRRRQGLSPSLFPFLAVLVCTLGTLILLLGPGRAKRDRNGRTKCAAQSALRKRSLQSRGSITGASADDCRSGRIDDRRRTFSRRAACRLSRQTDRGSGAAA